ncbi:MAG TPA: hypothetical protein PKY82_18150 [Pyrinomonadaceae bacterium]|nr:hypothetical protein [Pyrinomonadaceae bacterium]
MMQNAKKGKGPVKLMSFRQLLRFMEQRNKFLVELDQKNRIGEAPLHILANQRNITLAEIFNLIGQKTKVSGDLHNRPRLLIRHGSKSFIPFSNFEQAKEWNLYLDISTLLLAQKLGILDQIETSFKQLKISPISVTALIKQRDDLNPDQQSERSSRILISQLYEEKKFKLYEEPISQESIDEIYRIVKNDQINSNSNSKVSNKKLRRLKKKRIIFADPEELERQLGDRLNLIASAYSTNGLSVLLKPIICYGTKDNSVLRLPELISNQIINCREICESLKAYNRISDDVYKKAISSLGQEANFNSQLSPLPKAKLYLMEAVAILLAKAGILKEVCETFEVFLSQKSVYSVTEAIKYYQECEELGKQLDELIERINDGIDEGIYQFTVVPDEASAKDKVFDEKAGLDFNSTLQLFLPEPEENDVICIDDRALNKYSNRSGKKFNIPIIGINELLICLWQNDFIDEHKYYDLLLELRKCNFRYIPITHDEIIFHLQRAPFEKGRIIENEALAVLRQYYCSCLLDTKFLQIYDNSPLTELTFVTNSIESVNNSISKVWDSETLNIDLATAQSNWIFENLFTGFIGCSHLRDEKLINNKLFDIKTLAYDISNLLIRGLLINDEKDPFEINENRQHYFKWINDHILLGNCVSEPAVLLEIGQEIKARLKTAQFQKYKTDQERVLAGFFTGRFYLDLPKIVTDIITLNEEAKNWLQIRLGNGIEVHDILFETHNYWKAVEKAIAGEEVRVKSLKSDTEYIFTLQNNNADHTDTEIFPLILISNQENKEVGSIQDATFALLKADPDKRLDALRKMRHWFDCSQTEFEETVNQINKIDDPLFRAQEHLKIREKSIELFYLKLAQRFEENKIDYWNELLPPSAESLSGYFRLPLRIEGNNFSDIYREAAETLLKEEKLQFVISRLSSLPVSMPKKVIQNLSELTALEKLQILENLSYGLTSPIQILHLINLALRTFTYEDDKEAELTRNLINLLYETNTNQNNIKAFTAILSSCKNDFKYWNESNKWSPEIFLAMLWAHSSRLHNILRLMGLTPDFITSFFYSKTPAYPEILNRNPETWNDCIYPNRINRTKLLTHAAAKLFDGIPLELLERFEIPNLIKNEVFQNEDGDDIPYALLSDPNLSQNSLSSFFGGDRFETLSPIIGGEKIEAFKTENLRSSVGIYLQSLINTPEDLKPWVMIYLIAEDLPIYLEWQKLLSKALRKFDPKALFQLDVANPSYLLLGATDQIPHLIKEDFRPIFRNHILEAATEIATITDKKQRSLTKSILMEAVFSLSFHPGKPTLSSEFFVSLLEEIENIWGDLSNNYRSFESDFIWNIPVDESKPWRLFDLKIRANRKLNKMY